MEEIVPNRLVVDIGCGSGVLSCCAVAMGAAEVYAIDIDSQALVHARENVIFNGMEKRILCSFAADLQTKQLQGKCVAVMNMIQSEQVHAWKSVSFIHDRIDTLITSGILEEDEQIYFSLLQSLGLVCYGQERRRRLVRLYINASC